MEELEPKPQDPLQYLENDTRPEEVNPRIAVIDGEYKTAEQYLSEVENVRSKAQKGVALSLMGFGGALFSEGEGSLYAIGMSTGLAGALYFKIKENEEKQMLETFRKKFNLDYREGWGSKIEIKESYH